jgi:hypothetical protein
MGKQTLLFGLILILALVLGFITLDPMQSLMAVERYGYTFMLITYLLFGWQLVKSVWSGFGGIVEGFKRHWVTLLFLFLAAFSLHVHENHGYKIVADELVIGNTAMQMHFERGSGLVRRAYDYASNYTVFSTQLDKRPLAFPFLLATVHDLTGYRVTNVFWLNAVVSLALVASLWLVSVRLGGLKAGYAAVLLLCGVPLVAQNATGAGFELYNMMMIMLTLWLGMRYAERAETARLGAFVLAGVILAQVRYESVLLVLPVGLTILWVWFRERRPDFSLCVLIAPLLMLLVPWQHNVFKVRSATWQLGDVAGASEPFGFQYFYDNVGHALNFFFSFDGSQPNSWLLGAIGLVAVGFSTLLVYRQNQTMRQERPDHWVAVIFMAGLMLHTALMLCYFWGKWDDPVIRRLSLPTHVLLLVAVVFVWTQLIRHPKAWQGLMTGALLHLMLFAIPASATHKFTQENFAAATCNWVSDFIRDHITGSALAIDGNAGQVWFLHRQGSINPERLTIRWFGYARHFDERSFGDYIVVQRIMVDQETGQRSVSLKDDFGGGLDLEQLAEKTFAPFYVMRISRVVGIDREKLKTWAEARQQSRKEGGGQGLQESWVTESISVDRVQNWIIDLP